jgi:N-acetylmuramoyl-L-alanine amidase
MRFDYDSSAGVLRVFEKTFNVMGMQLEEKDNGTVLKIRTSLKLKKGEMTLDKRYQWYHVDLYNAKANIELLKKTELKGLVKQLQVNQFKNLLSLAFRLKRDPLSTEIYQDEFSNDVVVIWRTKEALSKADQEDITGENKNNSETKNQLDEEKRRWLIDTIVIDAGHGGKDPGSIGSQKLYEKDVVLPVALKLGKLIEKNVSGVQIVYTRKGDHFIELSRRTQIANENNGKVFISIHANSSKSKRASGFETFLLGHEKGEKAKEVALKENSVIGFEDSGSQKHYEGINVILATMAQSAFMKQSEHLAYLIQDGLDKRLRALNVKNRGIKQAPFWVMVGASMPSVLVEIGFITNSYEAKLMKTSSYQQKIAEGIFNGLLQFKEDYENAI